MNPTPAQNPDCHPLPLRRRIHCAWISAALASLMLVAGGCSRRDATAVTHVKALDGRKLTSITLQTDWYAQPEHGGFYQALLAGHYDRADLSVQIRQGGRNALGMERVILGEVQFANTSLPEVILARARGLPVVAVMAYMQHNPQAIMFHQASGITSFADLDGRRIMAGAGHSWTHVVKHKAGINFDVIPLDIGIERFLRDPEFVQQCFVTSEPYYARQQGAEVGTLLIADTGFNPYRVIYCRIDFAERNPELVRRFVAATIDGWRDYLEGDPSRTHLRLASLNPKQTPEFMAFSFGAIRDHGLVTGPGNGPEAIGRMTAERLAETARDLNDAGLINRILDPAEFASLDYLPPAP